jgi:putative ABC transport system permease protein
MNGFSIVLARLRRALRGRERDVDMAEELRGHVQHLTDAGRAAGMSPEEARRAALLRFGSPEGHQEEARAGRAFAWLGDTVRDVAYGARVLRASLGFTTVAVLTLGLGIGACVAIFSVVHGVLLRPPPFADPERVVVLRETAPARAEELLATSGKYVDWQRGATSFESLGAMAGMSYNASGAGEPVLLYGARITASLLGTLGVKPMLGRNFLPEEELPPDRENVAILSHRLWQERFGGRAGVVGESIQLNGRRFSIVGVLPRASGLPEHTDIFAPLGFTENNRHNYENTWLRVFARMRAGVTLAQAQSELRVLGQRIAEAHPVSQGWGVRLYPVWDKGVAEVRPVLLSLLGAVGFLLLIACANVANLLLARASTRAKELAVRLAMGASRARIVRQLLAESVLLSLLGAVLGVLVARVGLLALLALPPDTLPGGPITVNGGALAFTLALAMLTGVGFGLAPAFQATRVHLNQTLRTGRGTGHAGDGQRLRSGLVVGEVAVALVLLAGAGLLMRSFSRLQTVDPGFDTRGVFIATVFLPRPQYNGPADYVRFAQEVTELIAASPGVEAASPATNIPPADFVETRPFEVPGRPALARKDLPVANHYHVGPGYFRTMGIRLLRGRAFQVSDGPEAPGVAIVNELLARRFFGQEDPLGKAIVFDGSEPRQIVGVVGDVKPGRFDGDLSPQIYEPFAQSPARSFTLVVRAMGGREGASVRGVVRAAIARLDPNQPLNTMRPHSQLVGDTFARPRFAASLFAVFSVVALLLAAIGLYGVIAYTVAQRTQEIGVRMALGARARDVLRMVFAQGGRLVAVGLLAGLAGAAILTRFLQSLLFAVSSLDAATFIATPLVLAAIAFAACLLPAWRASRVDPMSALRAE